MKLPVEVRGHSTCEGCIPPFKVYISYISTPLNHMKITSNPNASRLTKILDSCGTACLITLGCTMSLCQVIELKNTKDLTTFYTCIYPLLFGLISYIKWIYCLSHRERLDELINSMELCHKMSQDIDTNDAGKYRYKMKINACQRITGRFFTIWTIVSIVGVIQWSVDSIIFDLYDMSGDQKVNATILLNLPYKVWIPTEITSYSVYSIYFTLQLFISLGWAIAIATYDTLNITFILYVCSQLEYLSETLISVPSIGFRRGGVSKGYSFETNLKGCFAHHTQILRVFEKLENIMGFPMFAQCLATTATICLLSLDVSMVEINSSTPCILNLLFKAEFWTGVNIELFFYCYCGTKMREMGLRLSESFYSCHWEQSFQQYERLDSSVNINRMLVLAILQSQKPMNIKGGPFYFMTLETFRALVSVSLSNAVILRQLFNQS